VIALLLDTNVVAEAGPPRPDPHVLDRLVGEAGRAAISAPSWHELGYGVERLPEGRRREALTVLLRGLPARYPILPYDQRAADWHARERAHLERAGQPRPFADGQIAAIAVTHHLLLVTHNLPDFDGFRGLRVQSWWQSAG